MSDMAFDPSKFADASKPIEKPPAGGLPNFTFSPENFEKHQQSLREKEAQELLELRNKPLGPIKAWSFSGHQNFADCPHKVYLSKVERMPDPSGPAAERGTRIHTDIENFIQGETDQLCKEAAKHFAGLVTDLRDEYADGTVEIEGDWGFDRDWNITGWTDPDVWARIKLDAIKHESPTSAVIYDWKSGRKFGNEMKHAQQLQLYAIGSFMRFPELEFVTGKMIYVDKNDELPASYTREEAMAFIDKWNRRGLEMTTATSFEPTPGPSACRWCPHGKVQEGYDKPACPHAYTEG